MQNPVRGFLHGTAALVSVAGLVGLILRSNGAGMTAAASVYGVSLVAMFATSALYHSVPWQPVWKSRFQSLDHTFIYALVAGTFTPLIVGVGEPVWIILGLSGVWSLVALGVAKEVVQGPVRRVLLPLQFGAVAVTLAPLWATIVDLDPATVVLTIVGGVIYLLGVLFFVNDRPKLAPAIFSHHEFFHVVVIVASVIHFVAVWRVVSTVV
ncbi:MAG: hemolysin III family protein [Actinobacteria bacterium]|nr:MAG: hemolysin III family protein [Actinomycetota bacterium]